MNCTQCADHSCRNLGDCSPRLYDTEKALSGYHEGDVQAVIQAAARLVDDGRGGTMNRLEEIIAYAQDRLIKHIGLAYCWGMEKDASLVASLMRKRGLRVSTVSCTTGGLAQDQMNRASSVHKVGCNPLGQAAQLNAEKTGLVVAMGLCLGHDMLLQAEVKAPCTTLVVKDRTTDHAPLAAIRGMAEGRF